MSDKRRIGLLTAVVVVLALFWWLGGRTPEVAEQRSFREHLVQVDTARLTSFTIIPAPSLDRPALHFTRDSSGWTVTTNGHAAGAFSRPLNALLSTLADVKPLLMAGPEPATIARYGLSDSLAARIVLGGPKNTVLRIGTSNSSAKPTLSGSETTTAVMLGGDPNVYLVPGAIDPITDMSFEDWIPKPLVNGDPANWTLITFVFPESRSYSLERTGEGWTVNGQPGDNEKVEKYLWALSRYYASALADPADTLNAVLIYSMRVVDSSRKDPIILGIFDTGERLIARSTLAPPWLVTAFDPKAELPRMFRPPDAFLPTNPPQGR